MRTLISISCFLLVLVIALPVLGRSSRGGIIRGHVKVKKSSDLKKVVIFLKGELPSNQPMPVATLAQRDKEFDPELLIVTRGTKVDFPNFDKVYHNVFSISPGNAFDLGLYRGGQSRAATMGQAGIVRVYCNIHEGMLSHIIVVNNDFYVRPKADGSYELSNVPPGTYTLVSWVQGRPEQEREVKVLAGQTQVVDLEFPSSLSPLRHFDKEGLPYGRYK